MNLAGKLIVKTIQATRIQKKKKPSKNMEVGLRTLHSRPERGTFCRASMPPEIVASVCLVT